MQTAATLDFYCPAPQPTTKCKTRARQRQERRIMQEYLHPDGVEPGEVYLRHVAGLSTEDLEDMLWEAGRGRVAGARLIVELPGSANRRSAPGEAVLTAEELEYCRGTRWREVAVVGMDMLPVAGLPKWLRAAAGRLNDRLCRTPFRRFARVRAYVLELR